MKGARQGIRQEGHQGGNTSSLRPNMEQKRSASFVLVTAGPDIVAGECSREKQAIRSNPKQSQRNSLGRTLVNSEEPRSTLARSVLLWLVENR